MTVFPAAILFLVVWVVTSVRDADRTVTLIIGSIPFGMFAAFEAGGLSLLVTHCLAAMTIALGLLGALLYGRDSMVMPRQSIYILAFALYSIFSALFLVRVFSGEILVFPMSVEIDGLRISTKFLSSLKPLAPSNSNIAQSGYILLSAMIFVLFVEVAHRRGTGIIENGLVLAAFVNLGLAALDLAAADELLSFIRTADYSLAKDHRVFGLPRVIGGYPEASSFGHVTSVFFAFFATSYLIGRKTRDAVLAIGSFLFALVAYSTTAYATIVVALAFLFIHSFWLLGKGTSRSFAHWLIIILCLVIVSVCVAALTTPLLDVATGVLDEQVLQKRESVSGLERSAWARGGFRTFVDTWGLGAGVGSIRANGFAAVLSGSVGLPGLLLFTTFFWSVFFAGGSPSGSDQYRTFASAKVAGITFLTGKLISGTTPDPELLFITLAALATAAKLKEQTEAPTSGGLMAKANSY